MYHNVLVITNNQQKIFIKKQCFFSKGYHHNLLLLNTSIVKYNVRIMLPIKISFYLLPESTPKSCDLYACRIVEKAYSNKHTVYINTYSLEEAQKIDTQLWTFRDISFIPHEIYNQNLNSKAQILIGYNVTPSKKDDILINLTNEIPVFYTQFNHIIEIVPNNQDLKTIGRKKYQTYQKQKLQIKTFNIK